MIQKRVQFTVKINLNFNVALSIPDKWTQKKTNNKN